jgi:hypothetical protein
VDRNLDRFQEDHFKKAVDILLDNCRKLAESEDLTPIIQDTFRDLLDHKDVDANDVISSTSGIVHYDADEYPKQLRESWEEFEEEITNRDFHTMLKRYVAGYNLVDRAQEREEITERRISSLAEEVAQDPSLITDEVDWMHEASSENAGDFGRELAKRDAEFEIMDILLSGLHSVESDSSSCRLFGSYLNEVVDSCEEAPKNIFERLRDDQHLIKFFPFLVRRADPSDEAAKMILDSVQNGDIPLRKISQIETIARNGELSEDLFLEIGAYLIDKGSTEAVATLVNLAEDFYRHGDSQSINEDLVIQALIHPSLADKNAGVAVDGHWVEWEQLAEITIRQDITNGYEIAGPIIGSLGMKGSISGIRGILEIVLRPLFEENPEDAWELVVDGFENKSSRVRLEAWLAGTRVDSNDPAILLVAKSTLWNWVDVNPQERAPQLARCIPPMEHEGWWPLAQQILIRYGDIDGVVEDLNAIEQGGSWGNDLFRSRRNRLQQLRSDSSNQNVRRWLSQEIRDLERFL